jgi:hypothetical protein
MTVVATVSPALVTSHFVRTLGAAERVARPYRHWKLRGVLPQDLCHEIIGLPIAPPVVEIHDGTRESFNEKRTFFTPALQAKFAPIAALVEGLQDRAVVRAIERTCGVALAGTHLRIEYIQDTDGAWLKPHPDIPDKLFSMVVYLFTGPHAAGWGTDIYDAGRRWVGRAAGEFNSGVIFIPASDTFHGFEPRPIVGIRRLLEVNYVRRWRDREQLALPDRPIEADGGAVR